jgi:hypothetical protein
VRLVTVMETPACCRARPIFSPTGVEWLTWEVGG